MRGNLFACFRTVMRSTWVVRDKFSLDSPFVANESQERNVPNWKHNDQLITALCTVWVLLSGRVVNTQKSWKMSQSCRLWEHYIQTLCTASVCKHIFRFITCCPLSECNIVSSPVFFRVKMMTLPVWLNRGAPATNNWPLRAETTEVTV